MLSLLFPILLVVACNTNETESEGTIFGEWVVHGQENDNCHDIIQLYNDQDHTFNLYFANGDTQTGTYEKLEEDDYYKLTSEDDEHILKLVRKKDQLIVSDEDEDDECEYDLVVHKEENETEDLNENNNDNDNISENENETETNETANDDYEQFRSDVDPVTDQGDPEVWFAGEASLEDGDIKVFGQTNLLPGSKININPTGENSSIFGSANNVYVEDDGTFYSENSAPSDLDDSLLLEIKFDVDDQEDEEVVGHYEPTEENLTGPFTVLDKDIEDKLLRTAFVKLEFPEDEEEATVEITTPDWNRPDDYGSTEVWVEAEIDESDESVHIKGTSNLIEGTRVVGLFDLPGRITIGYNDSENVNYDGSFELEIKNPEEKLDSGEEYVLELRVDPAANDTWPNVIDLYGENGENFEGSLVEKGNDDTVIKKTIDFKKE